MSPTRNLTQAILFGLSLVVSAGSASANAILRELDRSGMVQEDVNIMMRSAATLYSGGRAKVGDEVRWNNPASRADGIVKVGAVDGACVTLAHGFRPKGVGPVRALTTKRCLVDGIWVLSTP